MYFHMVKQRANAFANRFAKPQPKPAGVEFPITNKLTGERGTTETNKAAFAATVHGVDSQEEAKIMAEPNWRFKYNRYVLNHARLMVSSKPEVAVKMAQQDLIIFIIILNLFEMERLHQ